MDLGLESELKLNGFKNVTAEETNGFVLFEAEKPSFEVGAASKLKFAKAQPAQQENKVWKFSADDINEDDLIDTDDLLDDSDLKKPEVQVRDCGTGSDGKLDSDILDVRYFMHGAVARELQKLGNKQKLATRKKLGFRFRC